MDDHGPITPEEASRLMQRIEAVAAKRLAAMAPGDEPTFACQDCTDHGWIIVPCANTEGKCVECFIRNDHEVARACLSCEKGIMREAGIWFRSLYTHDRRGKLVLNEVRLGKFQRALLQMGGSAKRVQLALDSIIEREKGKGT